MSVLICEIKVKEDSGEPMRIPKGINPTISKTIAFDIAATLQQVMQVVDDLHARRIAPFTLIEQTPLKRIRWFQ